MTTPDPIRRCRLITRSMLPLPASCAAYAVTTTWTTLGRTSALSLSIAPLRFFNASAPALVDSAGSGCGSAGAAVAADAEYIIKRQAVTIRIEVMHILRVSHCRSDASDVAELWKRLETIVAAPCK